MRIKKFNLKNIFTKHRSLKIHSRRSFLARLLSSVSAVLVIVAIGILVFSFFDVFKVSSINKPIEHEINRLAKLDKLEDNIQEREGLREEPRADIKQKLSTFPKFGQSESKNKVAENNQLFEESYDPGFPPIGTKILDFKGQVFYEQQRRFNEVNLELVACDNRIYVSGAGMCEVVQSSHVILKPCIFREQLIDKITSNHSIFEVELAKTTSAFLNIPFEPYSRHITSQYKCLNKSNFKHSVQFMDRKGEGFITLNLPYTTAEKNAYSELLMSEKKPCQGIDIFLLPEQAISILTSIESYRKGAI